MTTLNNLKCSSITQAEGGHFKDMQPTCTENEGQLPVENVFPFPSEQEIKVKTAFDDNEVGRLEKCYQKLLADSLVNYFVPTNWLQLTY